MEGSFEFTSFPAVNAKMKCQEYPNAQDGNPEARSRDQILTLKASNTPLAKFCTLKNSRFTNLMYMHMWSHEIQYCLYDSEDKLQMYLHSKETVLRLRYGLEYRGIVVWFPAGALQIWRDWLCSLARLPLYRHKELLSWWQNSRGVQLTTHTHLVPKVRMHGTIPPLTHACTAWWAIRYGSNFYKTNNISYSKANFTPVW